MATGDESKETIILADADDNKSKDVVAEAKPNANPPPNHESTSTANVGAAMINDSIQSVVSKQPTATISTVAASDTVPVRRKLIAGKTLLMRRPWKLNMSNGAVNGAIGAINQDPVEYSNSQQQALAYQRAQGDVPGTGTSIKKQRIV
jgi:hypothetical protein